MEKNPKNSEPEEVNSTEPAPDSDPDIDANATDNKEQLASDNTDSSPSPNEDSRVTTEESKPARGTAAADAFNSLATLVHAMDKKLDSLSHLVQDQGAAADSLCSIHDGLFKTLTFRNEELDQQATQILAESIEVLEGKLDLNFIQVVKPNGGDPVDTSWMKVIDAKQTTLNKRPKTVAGVLKCGYVFNKGGTAKLLQYAEVIEYRDIASTPDTTRLPIDSDSTDVVEEPAAPLLTSNTRNSLLDKLLIGGGVLVLLMLLLVTYFSQSHLSQAKEKIDELNTQLKTQQTESAQLTARLETSKQDLEEANSRNSELQDQINSDESRNDDLDSPAPNGSADGTESDSGADDSQEETRELQPGTEDKL